MSKWQLSMGPRENDYIHSINSVGSVFSYPKGNAKMVAVPCLGDRVLITCKAKLIAEGVIVAPFHLHELYPLEIATVKIVKTYENPEHCRGQRRNWIRL